MRPFSHRKLVILFVVLVTGVLPLFATPKAQIVVHADQVRHSVTPFLTGACLEDVNHEIYGGIDSQMIFGESFAEPAAQLPFKGFKSYDGSWTLAEDGSLQGVGSGGAKMVWEGTSVAEGEISVDVKLTEATGGNGGLILKVKDAAKGADAFTGYEISVERPGFLVLGRHRQNWEPIDRVPCDAPIGEWVNLKVRLGARTLEVFVNGKSVTHYEDTEHPLAAETVGVRIWQHKVLFRNLSVATSGAPQPIPFEYDQSNNPADMVSGMWRAVRSGNAKGNFSLETKGAFSGQQSQTIQFDSGLGCIGIENEGLNRWGMNFVKGKTYEGFVYVRAEQTTELFAALESRAGDKVYAEKRLKVSPGTWQRLDFALKPNQADTTGRFAIKLKQPGAVTVGYALLQPGAWGRFKNLPVRRDIAEGLKDQGITVLRLGGCMANAAEYRWKKMLGPREARPPYEGWWYPHSSNGWGIFEFLDFCEAAGFLAVPDVNAAETPQDMADFVEYVNGSADTPWGRKRAAADHPRPYNLKFLQIGNEEQVNENYWLKFKAIAEAIWAKDSDIILVVGDFAYNQVIKDPFNFSGADGHITSLSAHRKILQLAKQHDREVWFDVHVWTDGPKPNNSLAGTFSYIDALEKIADGAKHKVVVFEFNANNHSQRRALANALALNAIERDGRLPIFCSANSLQPDGQNDNGWDQGLLFLNSSTAWLQPPGYVTRMISQHHQPLVVQSEIRNADDNFDVSAKRSENGKQLVLQVVNTSNDPRTADLTIMGFTPTSRLARVEVITAPLKAANTTAAPTQVTPQHTDWAHKLTESRAMYQFAPHSFTIIEFR